MFSSCLNISMHQHALLPFQSGPLLLCTGLGWCLIFQPSSLILHAKTNLFKRVIVCIVLRRRATEQCFKKGVIKNERIDNQRTKSAWKIHKQQNKIQPPNLEYQSNKQNACLNKHFGEEPRRQQGTPIWTEACTAPTPVARFYTKCFHNNKLKRERTLPPPENSFQKSTRHERLKLSSPRSHYFNGGMMRRGAQDKVSSAKAASSELWSDFFAGKQTNPSPHSLITVCFERRKAFSLW